MNRLTEEQRNWLDDLGIFRELPQETRALIAAAAEPTLFKLGEVVVREGESAESFFIVERGKARVVTEGDDGRKVTLATLEPGDSFGEQSLLFNRPAGASVRAATGLLLIAIPADTFRRVAQTHPAFRVQLEARIRQHSEFNLLRKLNVLSSLSLKDAQELATSIMRVELKPGDVLFHEGDEADAAYSIVDGRIRILKESANNTLLAVLGPGALIGEMALLHDAPRSAAAVAAGEQKVQLLRLGREEFLRIVSSRDAEQVLVKQASNRLQQQQSFLDDITEVRERVTDVSPSIQVTQVRLPGPWTKRRFRSYRHARTDHEHLAGIAALTAIDRFYRQDHNPESLIREQLASGYADDLESVSRKAEAWGYLTRLVSLKPGQLDQVRVPALVQTVNGSILVLHAIDADGVVVADPLGKVGRIPRMSFMERWSGRALLLSYVPPFADVGRDIKGTLRRLWPMVMPYRDMLFWILGLSTMVQLTTLAIPLFTKVIIDEVLVHGDRSLLVLMLVGIVVITAFQLLGQTLTGLLQTYGLRQVGASVVLRFFDHVLSIPYSISARWRAADFISRFAENEKLLTMAAQTGFGVLVSTTTSIVYVGALVSQSGKLTGIALLFVAAYAVLMLVTTPRLRENDRIVYRRKEDVQAYLIELVGGISTVKGLAAEDDFHARGMRRVADLMQAEFRGARLGFNIDLISKLLSQASTIIVLGYGAVLVLEGAMTAGALVAFNAMLGLLVGTLTKLISSWDELQEMRVSFERVGDVLSLPVESRGAIDRLPQLSGRVRFEGVRFRYDEGESDVLAGIDLEVLPGQKIALVGRSGSGKTTLANLVIKLLEPTEGRILIDGMDLAHIDVSALRAQIGVIEQSPYLFSGTVRENIARTNPTADLESVVAAATLAGAHEFIEALPLKYDTQVGERGSNLSGGQRQRLVIARALLNNPAILVMDEATSALDTETERSIQRNIDEVMAGRTVFTIAHRLSTVQNADRIVVVDGGQIRESGTHDELMERRGLYYYFHRQPEEALAA